MNILVLFGGKSTEHDVSIVSATSVIKNLNKTHKVYAVYITREGNWLYMGERDELNLTKSIILNASHASSCLLLPSRQSDNTNFVVYGNEKEIKLNIDVAFPVLHGRNGEDGRIQGLFEISNLPYVGCDSLSSAMGMDKAISNTLADSAKVSQALWLQISKNNYFAAKEQFIAKSIVTLGLPIFVKPANAGSSIGITKVKKKADMEAALDLAFKYDDKVICEECIVGKELECGVLGNEDPIASEVGHIEPFADFYDYDSKYKDDSYLEIPAQINDETRKRIRAEAVKIFKLFGCKGLARVDFFLDEYGVLKFNEINTMPGFTSISMYPKLFEAAGIPYSELLDKLLDLALERAENDK